VDVVSWAGTANHCCELPYPSFPAGYCHRCQCLYFCHCWCRCRWRWPAPAFPIHIHTPPVPVRHDMHVYAVCLTRRGVFVWEMPTGSCSSCDTPHTWFWVEAAIASASSRTCSITARSENTQGRVTFQPLTIQNSKRDYRSIIGGGGDYVRGQQREQLLVRVHDHRLVQLRQAQRDRAEGVECVASRRALRDARIPL
jgi:hypothetical protein